MEEAPPGFYTGHSEKDRTTERQEDPRSRAQGREGAQGAQGVGAASSSVQGYSGNVTTHPSDPQGIHTGGSPIGNGMSSELMGCSRGPLTQWMSMAEGKRDFGSPTYLQLNCAGSLQ